MSRVFIAPRPSSLEINSKGLEFDQFMKTIVRIQPEKPERKTKRKKKTVPKDGLAAAGQG
jgi:hypothetical protein